MFPQRSKVFPAVASVIALIYVVKNPVGAAQIVHQLIDAVSKFAGAL